MTNAERMYALDEARNARDWDTFDLFYDNGADAAGLKGWWSRVA